MADKFKLKPLYEQCESFVAEKVGLRLSLPSNDRLWLHFKASRNLSKTKIEDHPLKCGHG